MSWQTHSRPVTVTALAEYIRRQRAEAPIRLGVISNPFSRTNARTRLHDRRLPGFLHDPLDAVHTRTAPEVDLAIRHLLFERGVNVLGLNGGDGTLHLGVNRLLALQSELRAELGMEMPLPPLLFLNGGTLNVVSRATGTKGNPARTVRTFMQRYSDARLGELAQSQLPVLSLEVTIDGEPVARRWGFVFGSELVANALEMYGMFGEGYTGLTRFLSEVALGYTLNTRIWQEHGWKLDPPRTPVVVDERSVSPYLVAFASTIDLSLVKGVLTALRATGSDGFAVRVLRETDPGAVIRSIPRLMVGGRHRTILDAPAATSIRLTGGYTIDGEVFIDRTPRGQRREVTVRRAPFSVRGIAL